MDNPSPDGQFSGEVHSHEPPAAEPTGFSSNAYESSGSEAQRPLSQTVYSVSPESAFPRKSGWSIHALAGLQAGIVGVIWMFACFLVAAFWGGSGIWSVPNLFSKLFYGDEVLQGEFFRSTWAGIALIVFVYGLIGVLWGCFWKERRKALLSFYGALAGLATYYLFFDFVWVHADPLIPLYAPIRQLQVAHILWGAALAKSPVYSARIAAAIRPVASSGKTDQPSDQEPVEIVSGELIQ